MNQSMDHKRNQDGYALIEVIVSAAVLAILALAVLSGMDGATLSTAREKARAMAGALAEQDQERLRSFRFDSLAAVPQANPVTIDGVTYTIESKATWITDDANSEPACGTAAQKQSEYLRIVSTVTSNLVGKRIAPVKIESMVAPSIVYGQDHGTLAVRVGDRADVGVPDIVVNAKATDGTLLTPQTTNAQGCALFRSVKVGGYTISLNQTGYISKAGKQLLETTTTVNPNFVNNVSMTYDKKINLRIAVKTLEPGEAFTATSVGVDSQTKSVSDKAADPTILRTFRPASGAWATLLESPQVPDLFPYYNSPYSLFTGDCAYMSPTKASATYPTYFSTINNRAAVQGNPTVSQPQNATVFQPALNIRIWKDSSGTVITTTDPSRFKVYVKLKKPSGSTDTCSSEYAVAANVPLTVKDWPVAYGTRPTGSNGTTNFVSRNVTGFDAGLPFGTYALCVVDMTKSQKYAVDYANTDPSGRTASTLEVSSWSGGTTCP
jgi:prepilin-type N-terminal cleavage/methylation domain-containing protein